MPARKVLNRVYDKEYFSGTQAALYIGDVFVDEVTAYEFEVSEVKTPIYGYASKLFDAVSDGPVIVQGQFSINFKENYYLYVVLQKYLELQTEIKLAVKKALGPNFVTGVSGKTVIDESAFDSGEFSEEDRQPSPFRRVNGQNAVLRKNIEEILDGAITEKDRFEFYRSLSGFATTAGARDANFENTVEALEDALWKQQIENLDRQALRPTDPKFNGFDIYLTYGDFNNPDANHTVERISRVHLTKRAKTVNVSGEPIQEWYSFFARNSF